MNFIEQIIQLIKDFNDRLHFGDMPFIEMAYSKKEDPAINVYVKTNLIDEYPLPKEKVLLLLQKLATDFLPNTIVDDLGVQKNVSWLFLLPEALYTEEVAITNTSGDERIQIPTVLANDLTIPINNDIIEGDFEETPLPNESMQELVTLKKNASEYPEYIVTNQTFSDIDNFTVPLYGVPLNSGVAGMLTEYGQYSFKIKLKQGLKIFTAENQEDVLIKLKDANMLSDTKLINKFFHYVENGEIPPVNIVKKIDTYITDELAYQGYELIKYTLSTVFGYEGEEYIILKDDAIENIEPYVKQASFSITATGFEKEVLNQGLNKLEKFVIGTASGVATGLLTFSIVKNLVKNLLGGKK